MALPFKEIVDLGHEYLAECRISVAAWSRFGRSRRSSISA